MNAHACGHGGDSTPSSATDPVCGMSVDPATSKHQSVHDGQAFHFCCGGCKAKFEAEPARYLAATAAHEHDRAAHGDAHGAHLVKDAVCGMSVDPHTAQHRAEHDGRPYHFCSARCREKFVADPAAYLGERKPAPAAPAGTVYTCPMHPEVQQVGPGHCPKCGMALEPMMPSLDEDDGGELRAMTRRFWWLVALTLPVFALAMGPHLLGWHLPAPWDGVAVWGEAALASVVVLWGGAPFFVRGWRSLKPWSPNMYTLIALGTGVAWLYSAVAFVLPGIFPDGFRDMHGRVAVYFESAAVIVTLVTLGDFLELRARRRTGAALKALLGLAPKTARRIAADGSEEAVLRPHRSREVVGTDDRDHPEGQPLVVHAVLLALRLLGEAVEHPRLAGGQHRHVDDLLELAAGLHHRLAGVQADDRGKSVHVLLDQGADAAHELAAARRRDRAPRALDRQRRSAAAASSRGSGRSSSEPPVGIEPTT